MSISVNDLMIPIKFFNTCISDQKTEGIEYWKWHRAIGQQIDGAVLRISAIVCTLRMTFHMAPRLPRPRGRPRPRPRALPGALKAGLFILANQCGTNPVWFIFLSHFLCIILDFLTGHQLTCLYPHRPVQSLSRGDHNPRGPGIRDHPRLPWLYRNSTEKRKWCKTGYTGFWLKSGSTEWDIIHWYLPPEASLSELLWSSLSIYFFFFRRFLFPSPPFFFLLGPDWGDADLKTDF